MEAAKEQLAEAEAATACALREAHEAREEAEAEALAADAARAAKGDAERAGLASERRAKRDRTKMLKAFGHELVPTNVRSVDEWATLGYEARRKAGQRDRVRLKRYLEANSFRSCDIADVLDSLGLVEPLAKTKPFFNIHFFEVRALMKSLEEEHFGLAFGLFMHYDMRLTMPKLLQVSQMASKEYHHHADRYMSKPLLYNPFVKDEVIMVPRLIPPSSKLIPAIRELETMIGVQHSDDGRMAFRDFDEVFIEVLSKDPGTQKMPPLDHFRDGKNEFPIVICLDATGYGNCQFNTIAVRNPYLSASAQHLRIFSLWAIARMTAKVRRVCWART